MIDVDDDRLALVLASVGDHLVVPVSDASAPLVDRRPAPVRRRRLTTPTVAVAASLVLVVTVAVLAVAPLRRTVADWLGLGATHVRVERVAVPTDSLLSGVDLVDRSAAERALGRALPSLAVGSLGAPTGYALMPEGGVLVAWADGTTLWMRSEGEETRTLLEKAVVDPARIRAVTGVGDQAVLVQGRHVFSTPHRTVGADNVVLWLSGRDERRLESDREPQELIELAMALEPTLS